MEHKIRLLLNSYGLEKLLEINDIDEYEVVLNLVMTGDIDLDDYFYTIPFDVDDEDYE